MFSDLFPELSDPQCLEADVLFVSLYAEELLKHVVKHTWMGISLYWLVVLLIKVNVTQMVPMVFLLDNFPCIDIFSLSTLRIFANACPCRK